MYKLSEISERYKEKLCTADEAVRHIKDGDKICYGIGANVANELDAALGRRAHELHGVRISSLVTTNDRVYDAFTMSDPENITFESTHFNGFDRIMNNAGRCWYVPILLREAPSYWYIEDNKPDVVMITVGPMDKYGNFNMGCAVGDTWGAIDNARTVIVEVNKYMPKACGDTCLPLSSVDYVVEGADRPLVEIPSKPPTEIDQKIAEHVVKHIKSHSTIQLGIGGMPNCVGKMICDSDIEDLSCHTEMLVDSYLDMYEAGKITGNKHVMPGKMVYTFAGGTKRLYDFIDDNPLLEAMPANFTNDIEVISQLDNFVSINGAIAVDLFGQVTAETIGAKHFSGTGGQLDFVQGAYKSKGGASFLALSSTKTLKNGKTVSTIQSVLAAGAVVTTPRMATHYVATEYGCVNLKGKSTAQRAELLASIAHPDFREQLIHDAEKLGIWKTSSIYTGL